ncbi:hypothetical protein [Sinirhodobacter huangdaonensis]|uniref:Uncharacterized protein n=1 Tax=Paenirhodobacter huangdaonensis TaxID=2501515 RepID=A0A3S3LE60_9RHOB|nr:hypothetical protein [Sinirhodobacter huangdaonensis]RWR53339.1 hypothetical protein EOW66_06410 [Sinirhodobacter huangdaonensis]
MTDDEHKRAYLDWWKENGDAAHMATSFPYCGCETADPVLGGFGPINDEERLRYFAVSRSDIDLKRSPKKSITSSIFKRCFKSGMSVCRLTHASRAELNFSAQILHEYQVREHGEFGGVLGVVDFAAVAARRPAGSIEQICCVVDTPLSERNAHADVVSSKIVDEPEVQTSLRLLLFNAIGGVKAFVPVAEVTDCDLLAFRPAALVS